MAEIGYHDIEEPTTKLYEQDVEDWWAKLPLVDRERAFYAVVKRIHQGELVDQGSYRYILYNIFGFDPSYYAIGMDCGFMSLHNSIMSDTEHQIIETYYESKTKKHKECKNKVNGSCPLHNLQCSYPTCEE